MFRGIDEVYKAVSPLLAKHGLVIVPRMLRREVAERLSTKGTPLFYVTVEAEFDFVSAEDASQCTVRTFGEAMDSGDKATNKAMSAAYKYAAFQTFAIPAEGDNDADATTHQVESRFAPVDRCIDAALDAMEAGNEDRAWEEMEEIAMSDDNELKLYVWNKLGNKGAKGSTPGSQLRALLKKRTAEVREREAQLAKMPHGRLTTAEELATQG